MNVCTEFIFLIFQDLEICFLFVANFSSYLWRSDVCGRSSTIFFPLPVVVVELRLLFVYLVLSANRSGVGELVVVREPFLGVALVVHRPMTILIRVLVLLAGLVSTKIPGHQHWW